MADNDGLRLEVRDVEVKFGFTIGGVEWGTRGDCGNGEKDRCHLGTVIEDNGDAVAGTDANGMEDALGVLDGAEKAGVIAGRTIGCEQYRCLGIPLSGLAYQSGNGAYDVMLFCILDGCTAIRHGFSLQFTRYRASAGSTRAMRSDTRTKCLLSLLEKRESREYSIAWAGGGGGRLIAAVQTKTGKSKRRRQVSYLLHMGQMKLNGK